jgi:hypothetical protein
VFQEAGGVFRRRSEAASVDSLTAEPARRGSAGTNPKESIGRNSEVTPTRWQVGAQANRTMAEYWGIADIADIADNAEGMLAPVNVSG